MNVVKTEWLQGDFIPYGQLKSGDVYQEVRVCFQTRRVGDDLWLFLGEVWLQHKRAFASVRLRDGYLKEISGKLIAGNYYGEVAPDVYFYPNAQLILCEGRCKK